MHRIFGWISIPLGVVAGGFATYFLADALSEYQLYSDSTVTTDIQLHHQEVEQTNTIVTILGGVGFGLTGLGTTILLATPDREKLEIEYREVGEKIRHLEKQLR